MRLNILQMWKPNPIGTSVVLGFTLQLHRKGRDLLFFLGKSFLSTGLRRNNIKLIQVGETAASADGSSSSTSCGNNTATGAGEAFLCESENRKATGAGGLKL